MLSARHPLPISAARTFVIALSSAEAARANELPISRRQRGLQLADDINQIRKGREPTIDSALLETVH